MPPAPAYSPQPVQQPNLPPIPANETLSEIEQSVSSPHLHVDDTPLAPAPAPEAQLNDARSAVEAALSGSNQLAEPIAALNAQPLGAELQHDDTTQVAPTPYIPPANLFSPAPVTAQAQGLLPNAGFSEPSPGNTPADDSLDMPLPANPFVAPGQLPAAPGMSMGPAPVAPSAFPGAPAQGMNMGGQTPPPPVPPPMLPPLQ
jgi:hypothetical protein